ncbi:uncharacterized protein EMH_0094880 [Eimeria mitis]|uniref:Uncharacterized protein n=1 Tax=Eimeria mitis TaxID=44415 RepID=U6KKC8_9EIME|nr:uncharacterized protein EMH_0094880 [Eimeria mitis]CDJ36737.1 hypothetical protein, conserved [Eimeria mitis]
MGVLRVVDVFGSRQPGFAGVKLSGKASALCVLAWPPQEVGWALRNALCSVLRVVDVFGSRQPELAYLSDVLGIAVVFYRLARA